MKAFLCILPFIVTACIHQALNLPNSDRAVANIRSQDSVVDADPYLAQNVVINGQLATPKDLVYGSTIMLTTEALNAQGTVLETGTCSAVVIARDAVLTAAHCLTTWKEEAAVASIKIKAKISIISYRTTRFVLHPDYTPIKRLMGRMLMPPKNDLALVLFNEKISEPRALLPDSTFRLEENQRGIITGFGRTSATEENYEKRLRFASDVPLTEDANMIYTHGEKIFCKGDSGGALYVVRNNQLVIVGINSYGDCKKRGFAEKVQNALPWIDATLKEFRNGQDI